MRISFNVSISPIDEQDGGTKVLLPPGKVPAQVAQLKLGLEPNFMVYDQTIKRANVWSNDDGTFRDIAKPDWSRVLPDAEDDPSKHDYVFNTMQCGQLALRADTYWPGMDRMRSVMLDLESTSWSKRVPDNETNEQYYNRTFGKLFAVLWNVGAGCGCNITPNREGNQERTRVGVYGWPDQWVLRNFTPDHKEDFPRPGQNPDAKPDETQTTPFQDWKNWKKFIREVDYFAPCLYDWCNCMTEGGWFGNADKIIRDCRRHVPWMPVVAVISPFYMRYGSVPGDLYPDRWHLDGKVIPAKQWKKKLAFLKDQGCEVYIWTPALSEMPWELEHLYEIAARFL